MPFDAARASGDDPGVSMNEARFRKAFLLLLVVAMSVGLVAMLRPFLTTILTAAIFAGLAQPLYIRLNREMSGKRPLAAGLTLALALMLVAVPLLGILGIVVNQTLRVTGRIGPVVERFVNEPTFIDQQLQRVPGYEHFAPYRGQIVMRLGEIVNTVGTFLVESLSNTTRGTVAFVFHFFLLLYTMFFLLMDGPAMLRGLLTYLPLHDDDKQQIVDRFMSVTRATVRGTIIIGIIQGTLAGLAFWVVGIPDALFWAVVMVVLSILPAIGGALIWVPACIILAAMGEVMKGVLLASFCALIVGSIDNVLRPRLVGRDTKMHDLVILFSTLGGILTFGPIGFIIGPILAGLFVTSWEIFGVAYRDVLRDSAPPTITAGAEPEEPRVTE
jgi:predicted PurR-regulated permease PerM